MYDGGVGIVIVVYKGERDRIVFSVPQALASETSTGILQYGLRTYRPSSQLTPPLTNKQPFIPYIIFNTRVTGRCVLLCSYR